MTNCDIIIPVWNQLSFTKDCIDSIKKCTGPGYRLVIIDNGSDAETRSYLDSLAKKEGGDKVRLIRKSANVGFIKAVNEGICVDGSSGGSEFVCALNNDTIVTKGWLKEMILVAAEHKEIGIVNPSSNNLGQKPAAGEPLDLYADKFKAQRGVFVEMGAAIGFCMLIKREVIDKIGLFDEIYGMGNFEDTDFSRRAAQEGYRCVRACGAYVYHREHASFGRRKSFDEDFRRNREIFEFRWGRPKRFAYVLDSFDDNSLKKLANDSIRLARGGNWVCYFPKTRVDAPRHSNITVVDPPARNYHLATAFRILKKKKRFDEILVGDEAFGKVLENLAFIHKAKVRYY